MKVIREMPDLFRLGRAPIGSMVCVPLFDKEEFIGTLTASSPEKAVFDERKLRNAIVRTPPPRAIRVEK